MAFFGVGVFKLSFGLYYYPLGLSAMDYHSLMECAYDHILEFSQVVVITCLPFNLFKVHKCSCH